MLPAKHDDPPKFRTILAELCGAAFLGFAFWGLEMIGLGGAAVYILGGVCWIAASVLLYMALRAAVVRWRWSRLASVAVPAAAALCFLGTMVCLGIIHYVGQRAAGQRMAVEGSPTTKTAEAKLATPGRNQHSQSEITGRSGFRKPARNTRPESQSPATAVSAPNGIAIGGNNNGTATVNNFGPPRRQLTEAQAEIIRKALAPFKGQAVSIACSIADSEACNYGGDFAAVFASAGWKGAVVDMEAFTTTSSGIEVETGGPAGRAFINSLLRAHVPGKIYAPPEGDSGTLFVRILGNVP